MYDLYYWRESTGKFLPLAKDVSEEILEGFAELFEQMDKLHAYIEGEDRLVLARVKAGEPLGANGEPQSGEQLLDSPGGSWDWQGA